MKEKPIFFAQCSWSLSRLWFFYFQPPFQAKVRIQNYCPGNEKNEAFSLASFSLLFVEWAFSLRSGHLNLASTSKFHGTKSNKNGMVFVTFCCFSFFMLSRANLIFLDLQSSANNNVLPSYKKMLEVWHGSFIVFWTENTMNFGQMQSIFWIVEAWSYSSMTNHSI